MSAHGRYSLCFLFFVLSAYARAQLLDNQNGNVFGDLPFFNDSIVHYHRIYGISGSVGIKRPSKAISPQSSGYYFEFDTKGRLLIQYDYLINQYHTGDTVFYLYEYDEAGRLKTKRKCDYYGTYAYYYTYDERANLSTLSYVREENANPSPLNFAKKSSQLISEEKITREQTDTNTFKQVWQNEIGKPFKETICIYDNGGHMVSEDTRYLITGKTESVFYSYNDSGFLVEKITRSAFMNDDLYVSQYMYDITGNLYEQKDYKNKEYQTNRQYVYDNSTNLLKAVLSMDMGTQHIRIITFHYNYYR